MLPRCLFFKIGLCGIALAASTLNSENDHPLGELPEEATLAEIVGKLSGHRVLDWNGEERESLVNAAVDALNRINKEGIARQRINEVGLDVEDYVEESLRQEGFEAGTPRTVEGKRQAVGYPDIAARKKEHSFYIEVKVHGPARNTHSTFLQRRAAKSREMLTTC